MGDLEVNRLGFGTMRLAGSSAFGQSTLRGRDQAIAVVQEAVALGVNHFDTAAFYFSPTRSSNELLGAALRPWADGVVIASKVGPGRDTWGDWTGWARPDQLRGQVEENLRQLGRDYLDVVNLRVLRRDAPVTDHIGALAELSEAGLVRHVGVSNVSLAQLNEARLVTDIVCVQNRYGLTDREYDDLLRVCGEHGIAFTPYFAIAGAGRESGRASIEPDALVAVADSRAVTTAQVRLAWCMHQGDHVLAIPGTGNPVHLRENVAAGSLRLTSEELSLLDATA
ncbi:aldo/keto reductase [Nocardioides sp. LHG3406-4]|uniref:aldo/keto reductase n=1 Tax=Nocardioides sp. LHG3406-4 TaxID=2804575 RepID=UPI003CF94D8E